MKALLFKNCVIDFVYLRKSKLVWLLWDPFYLKSMQTCFWNISIMENKAFTWPVAEVSCDINYQWKWLSSSNLKEKNWRSYFSMSKPSYNHQCQKVYIFHLPVLLIVVSVWKLPRNSWSYTIKLKCNCPILL